MMISITCSESVTIPSTEKLNEKLEMILHHLQYSEHFLSVYFTNDEEIAEYNHQYRNFAKATDVLSWSYLEDDSQSQHVGDMMISMDTAYRQAEQNGWDLMTEILRLCVHGMVHIVGYDHQTPEEERKMLSLEKKLLALLGLQEIYPEDETIL